MGDGVKEGIFIQLIDVFAYLSALLIFAWFGWAFVFVVLSVLASAVLGISDFATISKYTFWIAMIPISSAVVYSFWKTK